MKALNSKSSGAWLALWLVAAIHLTAYAFIQPIWSRVDEAQHFHFAEYLAEKHFLPVTGETFISKKIVDVSLAVDQWGWNPAHTVPAPLYLDPMNWRRVPEELRGEARAIWIAENLWYFDYEAMQPPLYYLFGAVAYKLSPGHPFQQIYFVRVLSALIASLTVPLAYATIKEAFPADRILPWAVPLSIALIPGFILNLSQVTNDSLATVLGALALYLLVRALRRGVDLRGSLLLGLVVGLSLLTKLTMIYLVPLSVFTILLAAASTRSLRSLLQSIKLGAVVAGCAAAILLPWLMRNWLTYGDPTGSGAASGLLSAIFPALHLESFDAARVYVGESVEHLMHTFWFGEPFSPWQNWELPFAIFVSLSYLSLPGLGFFFWRTAKSVDLSQLNVGLLLVATVIVHMVEILVAPTFGGLGVVGRYLYPSVVPIVGLIWLGLLSILRDDTKKVISLALIGGLVALDVVNLLFYLKNNYIGG